MNKCRMCGCETKNEPTFLASLLRPDDVLTIRPLCDDCMDRVRCEAEWENEQFMEKNAVCPWCYYENEYSWEYEEGTEDAKCHACGRVFVVETEVERTYTTKRRVEDMPEGWDGEEVE